MKTIKRITAYILFSPAVVMLALLAAAAGVVVWIGVLLLGDDTKNNIF
jgi:hypothetical protein